MKRLKNLKMLILSMAITGIFGISHVSAVEGNPNQQNNNNNNNNNIIIDQNLLKQHYDLWIQMIQEIIDILEFDENKNIVKQYKENLQQIIAGNFANDDQRARADYEGRKNLILAMKVKSEEMIQEISKCTADKLPKLTKLNINNLQKEKLEARARRIRGYMVYMFNSTVDDTMSDAGRSLFNFFRDRVAYYNRFKDTLKNIENYGLWTQMMQDIIDMLESNENKNIVKQYKENLQQIIARSFVDENILYNEKRIKAVDFEGRQYLILAMRVKAEEMKQEILKNNLQTKEKFVYERVIDLLNNTVDETMSDAGQSLFNFFRNHVAYYNKKLKGIEDNNLPQNNRNNNGNELYGSLFEKLFANAERIENEYVEDSLYFWKEWIKQIANSMETQNSKESVLRNLKDLEPLENMNRDSSNVKARKVKDGLDRLCISMKKKIEEMLDIANDIENQVDSTMIPDNISEKEQRDLKTEKNRLSYGIKRLKSDLINLKYSANPNHILGYDIWVNTGKYDQGFEFYRCFENFVEKYNEYKTDAQNFLNKVAQLQNNNNQ